MSIAVKLSKQENFIQRVEEVYSNEFLVTGTFTKMKEQIKIKHLQCGLEYDVYAYDFVNKKRKRCDHCCQIEKSHEKIENHIKENLVELDDYILNYSDVKYLFDEMSIIHKMCGCETVKKAEYFLKGRYCSYCSRSGLVNKQHIQYRINVKTSENEFVIDEFNEKSKAMTITHNICGRTFNTNFDYFYYENSECHYCLKDKNRKIKMKSHDAFIDEVYALYGDSYKVLSEYQGADEYVDLLHSHCGNVIQKKPKQITQYNFGCKHCSMSMPESIIYDILKRNNIQFDTQYKFDDCLGRRKTKLPFDFAILNNATDVKYLIEYDGQQHFFEGSFGGDAYEITVRNDKIKNDYCKVNNIKLFRIPYTQLDNINEVVLNIINNN